MDAFLETCFSGPVLPASILLLVVTAYWLMVVVGALGMELLDFDLDVDADFDADGVLNSVLGAGAATLKFLNIGTLPINIWVSTFALSFWTIAMVWNHESYSTSWNIATLVIVRNAGIAVILTKILTQPLRGKFDPIEPVRSEELIGAIGEVATAEVSGSSGQGRFESEASPLLLNIRTVQGVLPKGEQIRITEYDAHDNIYIVEKINKKDA